MAKIERVYNVPLRKEFQKVPTHRRAKKAVKALAEFVGRHMHAGIETVNISTDLNNFIWRFGMKNPPHHVKVNVVKEEDGKVMVDLAEKVAKKEKPAKEKKPKAEKKTEAPKAEHKHEEKKAETHKSQKEEHPKDEKKAVSKKKVEK